MTLACSEVEIGDMESAKSRQLYGGQVLPEDLCEILNGSLGDMECICLNGTNRMHVANALYLVLHRLVLKAEEHPIVSRFFTFTHCCFSLLRMKLLKFPSAFFSLHTMQPNEDRDA